MQAQRPATPVSRHRSSVAHVGAAFLSTVMALTVVAVPSSAVSASPVAQRHPATKPGGLQEKDPEVAAVAAAVATGERVEVTQGRTETTQVFADPDGHLTLETAAVPQRVERPDGSWDDVDLNLRPAGEELRPTASVADVRFSRGGDGPLVTLVRNGKSLSLSWDGKLPEPTVLGSEATYPDVLPDVDLVLRATDTGFAHVLVVKTPQAAGNADIKQVRFKLGGDATVVADPGAGLQAFAGDTLIATATPAVMWDSAKPSVALGARGRTPVPGDDSTSVEPGQAANVAPVETLVDGTDLVLNPDPDLLQAPASAFPLYVDPAWSTGRKRWAYATNNNTNNEKVSVARVGKDPEGSRTYRSFFEFGTTPLKGKHIESARVEMELAHSASCDETFTHMYYTGSIASTPRTKWSPSLSQWLAAAGSWAPKGDGCDKKPNQVVNFQNVKITGKVQQEAWKGTSRMTFGFSARNGEGKYEGDSNRWKKFKPSKAKLIVDYASIPGKPTDLKIAGIKCGGNVVSIGEPEPVLWADYPDVDGAGTRSQTLTASYEWIEWPASGQVNDVTPARRGNPGNKSVPADEGTSSNKLTGAVKGKTYAIRTRATDPQPYNVSGQWSAWCRFTVDTAVPKPPTVKVKTSPTLPGTAAVIELSSANDDVSRFYYGWDDNPTKWKPATGTTTKTATVTLTTARYGHLTFHAYAADVTGNRGIASTVTFKVERPSDAIAHWKLESYPGSEEKDALVDAKPAVGGSTPLAWDSAAPDHGWSRDLRLLGGSGIAFDRVKGGPGGWAEGPVPALDTSKSFSVAAWVRLADSTTFQTAVSKDGAAMSAFRLMYRPDTKGWCLALRARDQQGAPLTMACSTTAVVGKWTHLAGVYDDAEGRLRLYVDGVRAVDLEPSAEWKAAWASGWNAGGPVVVGRALDVGHDGPVDQFAGGIADVRLFDRALVDHDLVGQRAADDGSTGFDEPGLIAPVQVGRWDFRDVPWCSGTEAKPCTTRDAGGWNRPLTLTAGVERGEGIKGNALVLDGTHFASEPDKPTPTREYGLTQRRNTPQDGPSVLQDVSVLRTDQPFTVAAWVRLDESGGQQTILTQDSAGAGLSGFDLEHRGADDKWVFSMRGAPTATAAQSSVTVAADEPTTWHHLAAVFDPGRNELRLHVDGETPAIAQLQAGFKPWLADGPLAVGRSDQPAGPANWLSGSVDNVTAWQGLLTDAAVHRLYVRESPDATEDSAE